MTVLNYKYHSNLDYHTWRGKVKDVDFNPFPICAVKGSVAGSNMANMVPACFALSSSSSVAKQTILLKPATEVYFLIHPLCYA